jgi:rubrerythrin
MHGFNKRKRINIMGKVKKTYFDSDEKLSDMMESFCQLYVVSYKDADFAFDNSGYTATTPLSRQVAISKLIHNQKVMNRLDELISERNKHKDDVVDKQWILEKLKRIVNTEKDRPQYMLKALELLAKAKGMLTDVQEINVNETNPSDIAKEVFKKRKELNILEFKPKDERKEGNEHGNTNEELSSQANS